MITLEGITFREATTADATALEALDEWALSAVDTDREDIPGADDILDVEAAYRAKGGAFIIGIVDESVAPTEGPLDRLRVDDGFVVAMGGYLPNEAGHEDERDVADAAELHRMRVAPPLQGEGVGRQLLEALERLIQADGFEVALATTAHTQPRAVDFYQAAGYQRVDTSTYGRYELVHFEKSLS